MNNLYKKNKKLFLIFILVFTFFLGSCATGINTTGIKKELDHINKKNIKTLGIVIEEKEDFSVHSEKADPSAVAQMLIASQGLVTLPIGIIWYAIDSEKRKNADEQQAESVLSKTNKYNISNEFQDKIYKHAIKSNLFNKIIKLSSHKTTEKSDPNVDAILLITLKKWGLRRVMDTKKNFKNKYLKAEFKINAKITLRGGEIVWSLDEHYIYNKKYLISELQDKSHLMIEIINSAISDLSKKVVNKILYS